ncbi:DUF4148 domain-containing protein [Paraburkholderia dipogonis]|uniref:DUF4148 domain-containing protein n=1 Tax=Paraburkholderia dipogonis TaxID=1211383 RepID=UPI0038B895B7
MKVTTLLNRPVLATLLLSVSVTAFAAGGGGGPRGSGPNPYSPTAPGIVHMSAHTGPAVPLEADTATVATAGAVQDKTRAQVRAELLHAEEAGLAPVHKNDYPPSAETVARNRARFQQIEQAWKTDGQITASDH